MSKRDWKAAREKCDDLHRDEQAYVVELVGLYEAYRRVTNERLAA